MTELKDEPMDPQGYEQRDGKLHCTTCGSVHEVWTCKCGKSGTKTFMLRHLEDRWGKNAPWAVAAHMLVGPNPMTAFHGEQLSEGSIEQRIVLRAKVEAAPEPIAESLVEEVLSKIEVPSAAKVGEPKAVVIEPLPGTTGPRNMERSHKKTTPAKTKNLTRGQG